MATPSYEFDEFIGGGYYLVTPVKRPDGLSPLLPETIVTPSACFTEVRPWRPEPVVAPALLVGIGLHASLLSWVNEQLDRDINHGYGLVERVEQGLPLSPGNVLGFEPLGFEATSFHSWLCNYFPDCVKNDLNIEPSANGLLADFADAVKVTEYIRNNDCEPAIWLPWLIVQYPDKDLLLPLPFKEMNPFPI